MKKRQKLGDAPARAQEEEEEEEEEEDQEEDELEDELEVDDDQGDDNDDDDDDEDEDDDDDDEEDDYFSNAEAASYWSAWSEENSHVIGLVDNDVVKRTRALNKLKMFL